MRLIAMIVLAAVAMGCAPEMTEIAVSPDFTPEQTEMFIDAAETWFSAVPESRVPLVISEDRGSGAVKIGKPKRCVRRNEAGETKLLQGKAPVIHICLNMIWTDEQFRAVAMHELGHALARRSKHLSDGHVMNLEIIDAPTEPTESDRRYVASRYHGSPM
jgi:hypothetical protein